MSYPPEGCSYRVTYPSAAGSGMLEASFSDEFEFGDWLKTKEAAGEVDRLDERVRICCVTDTGSVPIDIGHPRLVRGRLEKRPA